MDEFPVDWLGRCGPHHLLVEMSPQEVRNCLLRSMTSESFIDSILATDRRYTGTIREDRFVVYPCKRGRHPQPNMIGKIKEANGEACIEFTIEMDSMVSAFVVLFPLVSIAFLLVPLLVFVAGIDVGAPIFLLPLALPFFLLVAAIGCLSVRKESEELLRFFLLRFARHRR